MSELSRRALRAFTLMAVPPLLLAAACNKAAQQPKTPLAEMGTPADSTANPHTTMSPAAKAALDSGNVAYRAGKYAEALKSYRSAADQAPLNAAPFFGIYMAADKLGNKTLADSAAAEIRKRSSSTTEMLSDSTLQNLHSAGPGAVKK
jgi:uncharacterized protein HemY